MPEITHINTFSLDVPLKDAFETSKGRKSSSPSVIVELRLSNGLVGLGAATPVKYVTGEDTDSVRATIENYSTHLLHRDVSEWKSLFRVLAEMLPDQHSARAALEIAVFDAFCKVQNLPMCAQFGQAVKCIETDLTIPIVDVKTAASLAEQAAAQGFRHLKMKVGVNAEEDIARVVAAANAAPDCDFRLDANQGFSPESAVRFTSDLLHRGVKVDMLEQPVDRDDHDGLRHVTRGLSVPVFADESVITPSDAMRLIAMEAVDGINVKLMKSGLAGALEIISICRAAGKQLMLGCMIESGIGISTAVHLACGTGAFGRLDLDAHLLTDARCAPFSHGFDVDGPVLAAKSLVSGHGSMKQASRLSE